MKKRRITRYPKKPAVISFIEGIGTVIDMGGVGTTPIYQDIQPQSLSEIKNDLAEYYQKAVSTVDLPKEK